MIKTGLALVIGFILGTIFGSSAGRWIFDQLVNQVQGIL